MSFADNVHVTTGSARLAGRLHVPDEAGGIVLFAHGGASSRGSPDNRFMAAVLTASALGTLLFDLLPEGEESVGADVLDIDLLGRRLVEATSWIRTAPRFAGLPIAYFGAKTDAAIALWAAAEPDNEVFAVVSRGGRPDLVEPRLAAVTTPTLLIVGSLDTAVLDLNRTAHTRLGGESRLTIVPGASHLFGEPGTLHAAAVLARDWFAEHLPSP